MTTIWVDGENVYKIEEMTRSKLVEVLSYIFKGSSFKESNIQYLRRKLKSIITYEGQFSDCLYRVIDKQKSMDELDWIKEAINCKVDNISLKRLFVLYAI